MSKPVEAKPLQRDPEALVALGLVAVLLNWPHYLNVYDDHSAVFNTLLGIAFGGRYLLRATSAASSGRVLAEREKNLSTQETNS